MSFLEPFERGLPPLDTTLSRVCGEVTEIQPQFTLLPAGDVIDESAYEFYSKSMGAHILMFDREGIVSNQHNVLQEREISVFQNITNGEYSLMIVPEGTRSFNSTLTNVASNLGNYSIIFAQLGLELRQIENANLGFPVHGRILDRFAWSADAKSPTGATVYLVPPYGLERDQSIETIENKLQTELEESGVFSDNATTSLLKTVRNGREQIG